MSNSFSPQSTEHVELLRLYDVHITNHMSIISVAAHDIYEACNKVDLLIKSWDTSESHEIFQVALSLIRVEILC